MNKASQQGKVVYGIWIGGVSFPYLSREQVLCLKRMGGERMWVGHIGHHKILSTSGIVAAEKRRLK